MMERGATAPLVSVAMPVYNGSRFVQRAIESVLEQRFTDFELVVVDDRSGDGSANLIRRFRDPRLRLFANETNLGMAGNWNRSIELTRGQYVTMLHQDDVMLPDNLARKVAVLQEGRARWVASDCWQIDAHDRVIHQHWFRHRLALAVADRHRLVQFAWMFFHSNYVCFTTIMWERALMAEAGVFTEEGKYCADVHMWLRMAWRARLYYLDERLIQYRWAQNLSLKYDDDKWLIADFLARRAAARDLALAWPWRAGLRIQYAARFGFRALTHGLSGRHDRAELMRQALRSVVV